MYISHILAWFEIANSVCLNYMRVIKRNVPNRQHNNLQSSPQTHLPQGVKLIIIFTH